MARRDNKTEHVMKLITKDGTASLDASADDDDDRVIETEVRRAEEPSQSYKTKLKIEIEPEIEFKKPVRRQPRGHSVTVGARDDDSGSSLILDDGTEYDIPDGTPYEVFTEEVQEPPEDREPETQEPETQEPETREPEAREAPEDLEPAAEAQAPPPEDLEPAAEAEAPEAEAPAAETEPPGWRVTVIDEVKALLKGSDMDDSLRQDEQRRAKKIQIENSLLNRSRNLINLSEVLTKELLPSVMERMDVCVCPICTGNVLALALNMLPTKYVTTDEGKQYTQLEVYKRQNELDVMAALTRACLRVKGSPRHEIIDDLNE